MTHPPRPGYDPSHVVSLLLAPCFLVLCSPEAAAETVLYAAAAPAEEVGGRYCGTAPRVGDCSKAAEDPALAQWVWSLAAHLCQLGPDELVA